MEQTQSYTNTSTKRAWIAEQARLHPERVFNALHHLIDMDWMREAYRHTRKDGAAGIDGVKAADYERELDGPGRGLRAHEALQLGLAGVCQRLGDDRSAGPVTRSGHGLLADRAAACAQLLRRVLVAFLAPAVDLVDLDRAAKQAARAGEAGSQAMAEMPGGLLRDTQFAAQLQRGDALEGGAEQVDRQGPGLVAELGVGHDGAAAHGEALVAGAATVGHGGMGAALEHVAGATLRASGPIGPTHGSEPLFGAGVIREHADDLGQRDAFAEPFPGALLFRIRCCHYSLMIPKHAPYINNK